MDSKGFLFLNLFFTLIKIQMFLGGYAFNVVLGQQKQENLCEFEPYLVYIENSKPASATQLDPVSNQTKQIKD